MLRHGLFPLREGVMVGFDDPESQGVLLQWGLWELHDAENDPKMDDGPQLA